MINPSEQSKLEVVGENDHLRSSKILWKIRQARELLSERKLIDSLEILDRLAKEHRALAPAFHMRAVVRELVGDFTGALSDFHYVPENDLIRIAKARLLAKVGFVDQATQILRTLKLGPENDHSEHLIHQALGVGGRRCDLYLLGIRDPDSPTTVSHLRGWKASCAIEHLTALGDFMTCRILLKSRSSESLPSLSFTPKLERIDRLGNLDYRSLREQIERLIDGLQGWLSSDEAAILAALASTVASRSEIVEIGSFCGRSTVALAFGSSIGLRAQIHAIDPHEGLDGIHPAGTVRDLEENLRSRVQSASVTIHKSTSVKTAVEWSGNHVGLLFIDAIHAYPSVREDFESWNLYVSDNGFIIFHDANQPGPNALIRELIQARPDLHPLGLRDSLFVLKKASPTQNSKVTFTERQSWIHYLSIVGNNYAKWVAQERRRLEQDTLRIIDSYIHSPHCMIDNTAQVTSRE